MRLSKAIFLLFAAAVVTADAAIHISNRGYSDVVVSVSPDVPATDAKAILDGIVVMLQVRLLIRNYLKKDVYIGVDNRR